MYSNVTQQLQKELVRKQILEKRKKLSDKLIRNKSAKISKNLLSIDDILNKSNYSLYLAINNEVETKNIISRLLENQKNIYLPSFVKKSWVLAKFGTWDNLESGPFGIMQPGEKIVVDPLDIDIAVFPGVAFDVFGNRLGYGSGVYDKLFYDSGAIKIGLAFEKQMVKLVPNISHDLKMNYIVTEERIINCLLLNN